MRMSVDGVAEGQPVAKLAGPSFGGRPTVRGAGVAYRTGPKMAGPYFNSQDDKFRGFWIVSGVTRDSAGAALGSCDVHLFITRGDLEVGEQVSDASGNYSFSMGGGCETYYVVAYKAGSPDVSGTTVNTIAATLT